MRKLLAALGCRTPVKRRLALLGVVATAAVAGAGGVGAGSAQAMYYGGCTYNWGSPCYIVYGNMNELQTMDQNQARSKMGTAKPYNGYAVPTEGHPTRDVCQTMMYNEGTLSPYGWTCNWGHVVESYPAINGYSAIGTGEVYYGISLYQLINWAEYGPCPASGNPEC